MTTVFLQTQRIVCFQVEILSQFDFLTHYLGCTGGPFPVYWKLYLLEAAGIVGGKAAGLVL